MPANASADLNRDLQAGACADPDIEREHRLVFHDHLATVDRNPQALADLLAQHYSMVDFGLQRGYENHFLHRSSTAQAGDLLLSCGYTSPILGTIGEQPGVAAINLISEGKALYEVEGREMEIHTESPLFFSPGQEYRYIATHYNGIVFHVDLDRLRRTASAMAGLGVSSRRFAADLDAARVIHPSDRRSRQLMELLRKTFSLLDYPELQQSGDLKHLQIDDLIYRNLALVLCPKLHDFIQNDSRVRSGNEQIFEELLEWANANLHTPIRLSQLEEISGYSKRHLQLAFQQRFGCGPIQWIRQQRLERVRQALLNPEPGDTVAAIAARFGFSCLSVFSRDFHAHFGLRASQLLREGKRNHQLP